MSALKIQQQQATPKAAEPTVHAIAIIREETGWRLVRLALTEDEAKEATVRSEAAQPMAFTIAAISDWAERGGRHT